MEEVRKEKKTLPQIEQEILNHLNNIKVHTDEIITLVNKNCKSTADDIKNADDLTYKISDILDEIRDLLFEFEDRLHAED